MREEKGSWNPDEESCIEEATSRGAVTFVQGLSQQ